MEKLQEIVKEIQELYNTQEKDYVWFCIDRAELVLVCDTTQNQMQKFVWCELKEKWNLYQIKYHQ